MATLLDFGVAAPHRNYDVTSRASNDVEFSKNFSKRIFSPKCTILPSYSKIEAGRVFMVHPTLQPFTLVAFWPEARKTIKYYFCWYSSGSLYQADRGADSQTWAGSSSNIGPPYILVQRYKPHVLVFHLITQWRKHNKTFR